MRNNNNNNSIIIVIVLVIEHKLLLLLLLLLFYVRTSYAVRNRYVLLSLCPRVYLCVCLAARAEKLLFGKCHNLVGIYGAVLHKSDYV